MATDVEAARAGRRARELVPPHRAGAGAGDALDRVRGVTRPGGLVFVETQISSAPEIAGADLPLWQFFPRDSLHGDATNKWAPNLAGLKKVLEECQFEILEVIGGSDRAAVRARSVADSRLEYYRRMDADAGSWGRGSRPAD